MKTRGLSRIRRFRIHEHLTARSLASMTEAEAAEAARDVIREFQALGHMASDWEVEASGGILRMFRACGEVEGMWLLEELSPEFVVVSKVMSE